MSDEELERHHAQRVEVGPRADVLAHRLLGRHVVRGADGHPGGREETPLLRRTLGDTEVGDLHAAVGGDHDVLGLQVAVDDVLSLRVVERREHSLENPRDLGERHVADVRPERSAGHVLHGDVRGSVAHEVVVDRDDVGMAEGARQPRLAQEAPGERRIGLAQRAQLLEGDQAIEIRLPRQVHGGHAAASELVEDLVAPDGPGDAIAHPFDPRCARCVRQQAVSIVQ